MRQLLQRGVPATAPHPDGRSALHDAVAGGHVATAAALLDFGADPNLRAEGGAAETQLPLSLAICIPHVPTAREMVRLLRRRGADTSLADGAGRDAPTAAATFRPTETTLIEELEKPLALPPLPAGWLEAADKSGRPYFFHARTKEARWEQPVPPIAGSAA